jgi:hypothetical protein
MQNLRWRFLIEYTTTIKRDKVSLLLELYLRLLALLFFDNRSVLLKKALLETSLFQMMSRRQKNTWK